jgi:SAM-dependent methyltransferase
MPAPATPSTADRATLVRQHLVCPESRGPLTVEGDTIRAAGSSFRGRLQDGVAVMLEHVPVSFFDDKFVVMQQGHDHQGGEWRFAYAQQVRLLEERLGRGGVILDVGCGPLLPYRHPPEATVIGLEYSLPSIAANRQVELPVCASAADLPLADASVDAVVCLYSIHHMTCPTVAETEVFVARILRELGRVTKPGGTVLIFEMAPVTGAGRLQRLFWNLAKKLLGRRLDMYFWPVRSLRQSLEQAVPGSVVTVEKFRSSPWTTFPPVFNLPRFRLPRFLYPLQPVLYRWQL